MEWAEQWRTEPWTARAVSLPPSRWAARGGPLSKVSTEQAHEPTVTAITTSPTDPTPATGIRNLTCQALLERGTQVEPQAATYQISLATRPLRFEGATEIFKSQRSPTWSPPSSSPPLLQTAEEPGVGGQGPCSHCPDPDPPEFNRQTGGVRPECVCILTDDMEAPPTRCHSCVWREWKAGGCPETRRLRASLNTLMPNRWELKGQTGRFGAGRDPSTLRYLETTEVAARSEPCRGSLAERPTAGGGRAAETAGDGGSISGVALSIIRSTIQPTRGPFGVETS